MLGFRKIVSLVVVTFTLMDGLVCAVEPTNWFSSAKDYAKSSWSSWQKPSVWNTFVFGWCALSNAYAFYEYHQWMSEYATVLEKEGDVSSWLWDNPPPFGENPSLYVSMFKYFLSFVDRKVFSTVCDHMHLRRVNAKNKDSATENRLFRTLCS